MSNYHQKNIKAYDKKADNYDDTHDGRFTAKFKTLLMASMSINDNDYVLDVGCGNGNLLSQIAASKKINGFGIDISPQMIQNAKARYPDINFAVSGCEQIPLDDNSMDVIIACATYHHFPNVDAFALEAKRLIKPKGSIYIAEVYLPTILKPIANVFLPLSKDGDVKFYSQKQITRTFSNAGFSFVKMIKKGHVQIIQLQG